MEAFDISLISWLYDNFPRPVYFTNTEKKIAYINNAVTELTGFTREEMIGVSIYDFYDFEDEINSETSPLIQCFERRVPISNHLVPYRGKNKKVFSFHN